MARAGGGWLGGLRTLACAGPLLLPAAGHAQTEIRKMAPEARPPAQTEVRKGSQEDSPAAPPADEATEDTLLVVR